MEETYGLPHGPPQTTLKLPTYGHQKDGPEELTRKLLLDPPKKGPF